jgi:hypothetical protein
VRKQDPEIIDAKAPIVAGSTTASMSYLFKRDGLNPSSSSARGLDVVVPRRSLLLVVTKMPDTQLE